MAEWKLKLAAGEHDRVDCPVKVKIEGAGSAGTALCLVESETDRRVPCQAGTDCDGNLWVHWILDSLPARATREYVLKAGEGCDEGWPGVYVVDVDGRLEVHIQDEFFTAYNYDAKWVRPFLWPVVGPFGDHITRDYPMIPDVPGEKHDHPHHKSIYSAHGLVNGVDDWSEVEGHGRVTHQGFQQVTSGPVVGVIQANNHWVSRDGVKVLTEQRTMAFYNTPGPERIIDYTVRFKADEGEVVFGDTKEGGILSVRVATSMDVASGLGGKIENAYGGINEAENWGKKSPWCDYSGPVKGRFVGITIMDHEDNPRYPTEYHVRNYGLFTANPFAWHDYKANPDLDGSLTLPAGEDLVFHYRLYIHRGDAKAGNVRERYHDFLNPPMVTVE